MGDDMGGRRGQGTFDIRRALEIRVTYLIHARVSPPPVRPSVNLMDLFRIDQAGVAPQHVKNLLFSLFQGSRMLSLASQAAVLIKLMLK